MSRLSKQVKVPVGEGAVADPVKDPENEPGGSCQKEDNQVCFPERLKNPTEKIEQDQGGVEYYEENINHFYVCKVTSLMNF